MRGLEEMRKDDELVIARTTIANLHAEISKLQEEVLCLRTSRRCWKEETLRLREIMEKSNEHC